MSVLNPLALSLPRLDVPKSMFVELNPQGTGEPVLVLPPLEGLFDVVQPLAKQLTRPSIGLNWTQDFLGIGTIEEAATKFLEQSKDIIAKNGNVVDLIGYSFGTCIAFEMALQLQRASKQVRNLILLDGSPSQIYYGIEAFRKLYQANDEESKLNAGLVSFTVQHCSVDTMATLAELAKIKTREGKLKRVAEIFAEKGGAKLAGKTTPADIEMAADVFAAKMLMMYHYRPSAKFQGNCLLVRAKETLVKDANIDYDYNLKTQLEFVSRLIELKLSPV